MLARDLDVGIYDRYLRNFWAFPALSTISLNASQQEYCFIVVPSGGTLQPAVHRERRLPCRCGATVVRTRACFRKVEIYDMFPTPGTHMPFGFCRDDVYMYDVCQETRSQACTELVPRICKKDSIDGQAQSSSH